MTLSTSLRPADLSSWLKDRFIPCWAGRTCMPGLPGYVEEFGANGDAPAPPVVHSTMVTGRLVYTFSMAHRFNRAPATLRAAEHGLAFLLDKCRVGPGLYAHRVGSDGRVIDAEADLYDLAFVLLALGSYSAASGKPEALAAAHEIAARLDGALTDPLGGYREPAGTGDLRLQYPQMHLFEAFQMLAAADPVGGWTARAERIVDLTARLVDEHGAIDEWFEAEWGALEPAKRQREIGHHFEWAWLLFVHGARTGSTRALDLAWRMFDFGLKAAGLASSGPSRPIANAIDAWGMPTSNMRPLWPTFELAKASLAAATLDENNKHLSLARRSLQVALSKIDQKSNIWINEFEPDDLNARRPLPVRTLYHIIPSLIFLANSKNISEGVDNINALRPF